MKNHISGHIILTILLLILGSSKNVFAQEENIPFSGSPLIHFFSAEEYQGKEQNFSLCRDSLGILYVGNFSGIITYNGALWSLIPTPSYNMITSLYTASNGQVYAGGRNECGFIQKAQNGQSSFKPLAENTVFEGTVFHIGEISGTIIFVSENKIYLKTKEEIRKIPLDFYCIGAFSFQDKIFLQSENSGLFSFDGHKTEKTSFIEGLPQSTEIIGMDIFKGDSLLFSRLQGIIQIKNGKASFLKNDASLMAKQGQCSCIQRINNELMMLGTKHKGAFLFNNDGLIQMHTADHPVYGTFDVTAMNYSKKDQNLWLSMNGGIALCAIPSDISLYNRSNGIEGDINALLNYNHQLYVAGMQGLFRMEKEKFTALKEINTACWTLQKDEENNILWAGCSDGLYAINNSGIAKITDEFVLSMVLEGNMIFAGTTRGAFSYNNQTQIKKDIIKNTEIRTVLSDGKNIWFHAPGDGVWRLDIQQTEKPILYPFGEKGLPSNNTSGIFIADNILHINYGGGILIYDKTSNSFSDTELFCKEEINNQWLNPVISLSNSILYTYGAESKESRLFKKTSKCYTVSKQELYRLKGEDIRCAYAPDSNHIWLGSQNKIFLIQTKNNDVRRPETSIFFTKIKAGDSIFDLEQKTTMDIPHKLSHFLFQFASTNFDVGAEVLFSYRLKGLNDSWSEWSQEHSKEYTNLLKGKYEFQVRTKLPDGTESDPITFSFLIHPAWYNTVMAYLAYIFTLILIIVLYIRYRSAQLMRDKQRLEGIIEERTHEINKQKEALKQQSGELSKKNEELEGINNLVKSINAEIQLDLLLDALLKKLQLLPNVDTATSLMFDETLGTYSFTSSAGRKIEQAKHIKLNTEDIEKQYLSQTTEVFEDIFLKNSPQIEFEGKLKNVFEKSSAMIIMLIRYKNRVMGYLIMENMYEHQAFDEEICEQFRNIKEHLVSAFIKTNLLHEIEQTLHSLESTQQELIRKEKLASVGKLTQGIVDRIINPLNYINNFAQLSAELIQEQNEIIKGSESNLSDEDTEELSEITEMLEQNVQKIHEHGTNTARIVKGMENLLRDRSGEKQRTDINSLLTQGAAIVQKEFSTYENGEKIIPILQLNKELNAPIIANGIAQVIYHLLRNAFYTSIQKTKKSNIERLEIEINSCIDGRFAVFSIKDYGMGISELEKKKIFDPFFTTKPTAEGTGTGLYIAKEIIQNHSGRIDVESSINDWTVFTVTIPIS